MTTAFVSGFAIVYLEDRGVSDGYRVSSQSKVADPARAGKWLTDDARIFPDCAQRLVCYRHILLALQVKSTLP